MGTNKRIYRAKAREWGLGESGTGKPQVAVSFLVLTEGATHAQLTWYGYFTDETFDRTVESLRHCGWQGDDLSDLSGLDANEVDLVVEDETYNGETRTRVQWVNKAGGLALRAPMAADRAKAFAASMRDRVRALGAGSRPPPKSNGSNAPPPSNRPEPPPLTDNDIPF
jgi:hypothetical protein